MAPATARADLNHGLCEQLDLLVNVLEPHRRVERIGHPPVRERVGDEGGNTGGSDAPALAWVPPQRRLCFEPLAGATVVLNDDDVIAAVH